MMQQTTRQAQEPARWSSDDRVLPQLPCYDVTLAGRQHVHRSALTGRATGAYSDDAWDLDESASVIGDLDESATWFPELEP